MDECYIKHLLCNFVIKALLGHLKTTCGDMVPMDTYMTLLKDHRNMTCVDMAQMDTFMTLQKGHQKKSVQSTMY